MLIFNECIATGLPGILVMNKADLAQNGQIDIRGRNM
jgi:hypothetical protein